MTNRRLRGATIANLLKWYVEAAKKNTDSLHDGDSKRANAAYRVIASILLELRSRDSEGPSALLTLLRHPHIGVRVWAATHTLEVNPKRAKAVLREVAAGPPSIERLDAEMVLEEWKKGRLKTP